jgi:hypothetical protein
MCEYLCGYSSEPANPKEARYWRQRYKNNHGSWPMSHKQIQAAKKNSNLNEAQADAVAPETLSTKSEAPTLFDDATEPHNHENDLLDDETRKTLESHREFDHFPISTSATRLEKDRVARKALGL